MKFNQKRKALSWKYLWPIALAVSLGACGDGSGPSPSSGSNSGGGGKTQKKGPATGRLLDAAVSGVAYASSSATGATDENGTFKYNHGDTVEFKLGSLLLGKVPGAAIVTPMELA